MYHVLTAEESRSVEQRAVAEAGMTVAGMMGSAGRALARCVSERVPNGSVLVACGSGNNGGDGWVCARELHAGGRDVKVLTLRDPASLEAPAREAARDATDAGVEWSHITGPPRSDQLAQAAVIVDALLGTGAVPPLKGPLDAWCAAIDASGAYVVSADVPTGVDSDTGQVDPAALHADCTVTFIAPKRGVALYPGAGHAGEVVVDALGVPEALAATPGAPEVWLPSEYAELVPRLAPDTHKNARGRLLIVAGSGRYTGAAVLAARGASRMGAGYVTVAVPDPLLPVMQSHLVSQTVVGLPSGRGKALSSSAAHAVLDLARDYDAVLIGPGLSLADGAVACVRAVVPRLAKPLVIDADALNALVDAVELLDARSSSTVLTPHPGELARLLGSSSAAVQRDRVSSCARLAGQGRTVVLKGAGTIVSDGRRGLINTSGTPALATAGTGDVLAGMVGALLAQGLPAFEAGSLGVYLHGRAGEEAASELTPISVNAEDVPRFIPSVLAGLLDEW